jgi:AcrR family transcriptional regulator
MPRAGLSPDAVVDVALALIDEKGLDALSLSAVADRAGVATPSLYKHVGSLADLRMLMSVRITLQVRAIFADAVMGRSRDDAVEALLRAYRAYVLENPARYALVPLNPLSQPQQEEAGRAVLAIFGAVMRGYDLEDAAATHAIRRMRAVVHGFATIEAGGGYGLPEDIETSFKQTIEMFLQSLR